MRRIYDPIHALVFQPLVDRFGIDARATALAVAGSFLLLAVTLSVVRVITMDPLAVPGLYGNQALHVVGATIVHAWMRFAIANRAVARAGALGSLHFGMRMMFVCCVVLDAIEMGRLLAASAQDVTAASMTRSAMQMAEDVAGMVAIYLSMSHDPPPRRRNGVLAPT